MTVWSQQANEKQRRKSIFKGPVGTEGLSCYDIVTVF